MQAKDKTSKRVGVSLNKSFKLINSYSKIYLPITLVVSVLMGFIPAISAKTMQIIINNLQKGQSDLGVYVMLISLYIGVDIFSRIVGSIYSYYKTKFAYNFDKNIKIKMQEKAAEVSLKDYECSETYNIINRALSQNGNTIMMFIDSFVTIIKLFISTVSTFFILAGFHMELIVAVIAIPVVQYFFSILIVKEQYNLEIEQTKSERKLWYLEYLFTMGIAYKEIKVCGLKSYMLNHYLKIREKIIKQKMEIVKKSTIVSTILAFVDSVLSGFIFAFYVVCGINKIIMIGDVITYTKCVFSIKGYLESILGGFSSIVQSALFIDFIFKFLDMESFDMKLLTETHEIEEINTIEVKDLSYKYNDIYVLKNVCLSVKRGQTIVLVGRNGSGKSTFLKILLGLYLDYEGEVLINGINLKTINLESFYRNVSCIFQDFMKYETTLRENIAFGDIKKINNIVAIEKNLERAQFKKHLFEKEGINTYLGNWFGDKQLSMGEWQKVAIGRLMFKPADVMFLDEPDAALDNMAENNFIDEMKLELDNKIGFWITHKLENAKKISSIIVVLEDGRIVETGAHEKLMEQAGVYSKLYYAEGIQDD